MKKIVSSQLPVKQSAGELTDGMIQLLAAEYHRTLSERMRRVWTERKARQTAKHNKLNSPSKN